MLRFSQFQKGLMNQMRQAKRLIAALLSSIMLVAGFAACQKTEQPPADQGEQNPMDVVPDTQDKDAIVESYKLHAYIGKTDDDLVEAKDGEGQAGTIQIDGKEYLLCRIYRELFFGLDCEVTYFMEENIVTKISVGTRNAELQTVIDAIVEKQGDTEDISQNGDNYVLKAVWAADAYTLELVYDGMFTTVVIMPVDATE